MLTIPSGTAAQSRSAPVEQIIQEVFLGETVYPQEALELQLTTGLNWRKRRPAEYQVSYLSELGLTDRLQLEVEGFFAGNPQSATRTSVGFMYNFFSSAPLGLALSGGFGIGFPTTTAPSGDGAGYRYEPLLIAYKASDPIFVNMSGAFEFGRGGATDEVEGEVVVAIFARATPWLFPTLEFASAIADAATPPTVAPGVLLHPGMRFELGAAIAIQLTNPPTADAMFLVTWEWQLFESDAEGNADRDYRRAPAARAGSPALIARGLL